MKASCIKGEQPSTRTCAHSGIRNWSAAAQETSSEMLSSDSSNRVHAKSNGNVLVSLISQHFNEGDSVNVVVVVVDYGTV